MKGNGVLVSLVGGVVLALGAPTCHAQDLLSASAPITLNGIGAMGDAPDSGAYAEGMHAINDMHWQDAIRIFSQVAATGGVHADGALYWKAYAENKQGQLSAAIDTCGQLRRDHPGSNWFEDCGALEIEIYAKTGQPVQPKTQDSDDLKLLALASLMQHDEKKAFDEIDAILNSDASQKLKQGALYIMGEHHTDTIYPQIARISYLQGDVRVARGEDKDHRKGSAWEQAVSGLPLETGFSLVTGSDGRAEIEFEDASTLYLGENSVILFNDLHTLRGVPYTEVSLLSGMVTPHIHPRVLSELFLLRTPTDDIETRYPQTTNFRINSYTDGIAVTPLGGGVLGVAGASREDLTPGKTIFFKDGKRIMEAGPIHQPDDSAFDMWVADRFAARSAAMEEVRKEAGLGAPLPGLADMAGKGKFFACEPYGTCWEPNEQPQVSGEAQAEAQSNAVQAESKLEPADQGERVVADAAQNSGTAGQGSTTGAKQRNIRIIGPPASSGVPTPSPYSAVLDGFPCDPGQMGLVYSGPPVLRNGQWIYPNGLLMSVPWAWAQCHAGGWIYRNHRYMWVVGRLHHHPPVHWVKFGKQTAFVPVHPHDVKDRAPVNRKNAVFTVDNKNGRVTERIEFPTEHQFGLMKDAPKEFRNADVALAHAESPHMTAHALGDLNVAKGTPIRPGVPITFNNKSESFMVARQEMHGGHPVTVNAPMSNHSGSLQARAGGYSGGGGWHAGSFGGGGSHGGVGGGASHGGGGSVASGGGGAHGGGGGGGVSSGGASGVSAGGGGGASGGGGSHH
ncbi:MAG TPA: hypothetical protein VKR52_01120 [Terracidiphilus sp.]|nr:hypothetical protein [Terracidiphilus sp.]